MDLICVQGVAHMHAPTGSHQAPGHQVPSPTFYHTVNLAPGVYEA